MGRPIDCGAENANARGEAEQAGNVEGFDNDDNVIDQHGEQRRPHDRQGDAQGRLRDATPRHGALLLQRRVHGAKRSGDHEKRRRHHAQALNEAHPVERINIERAGVPRQTENITEGDVDQTDAWIE